MCQSFFIIHSALCIEYLLDGWLQVCNNETYCDLLREEFPDDKRPHCPIELFLSGEALKEATVPYEAVMDRLDQEIGITMIEDFTESFIKPSIFGSATREVWVDELPPDVARSSATLPNYTVWTGIQADTDFTGGEFAWMMKPKPINLNGNLTVRGLANEFRRFQFPTLHLKGYPLCFNCSPGAFHSEESWNKFQNLRRKVVKYHPVIFELAEMMLSQVFGPVDGVSRQRNYIAVHLRRGDFTVMFKASAGIDTYVSKLRTCPESHRIYVATNEENATVLEPLRRIGAIFWSDIEPHISTVLRTQVKQLAFQDFVGLVEQVVCSNARLFVGTRSSSVTGHILNLRGDLYGNWGSYQFLHQLERDPNWNCSKLR